MFTGIVEEMGVVRAIGPAPARVGIDLSVASAIARAGAGIGDSITVGGVCLTVTALDDKGFIVGLAPETLRRTALGDLQVGDRVNLERSLPVDGRFGGHFVQGHVDGVATVVGVREEQDALWTTFEAPPELARYIVYKGYIALNGVSLTVAAVEGNRFSIQLIDHTRRHVDLGTARVGTRVNVEVDVLGKYVEKLLGGARDASLVAGRAS
ncbi:MAG: riboflavin synthase [Chloroflexi bacterium]|nr:riboflavin synthase [Chloroflexota bacterium]